MSDTLTPPPPVQAAPVVDGSRLPDLIALAGEASSDKRRLLLRELTDHFFGAPNHSATEAALYDAVLSDLSAEMETAVRAELAQREYHLLRSLRRLDQPAVEPLAVVSGRLSAADARDRIDRATRRVVDRATRHPQTP